MIANVARAGLLMTALALVGCSESSVNDFSPKAHKALSAELAAEMKAKGMSRTSPILARVFKEEGKVEIWKQKTDGRYAVIAAYDICKWSGKLGPKFTEGDRQAPEGFYTVRPGQMNPNSQYHLSFNIGYPNAYDKVNGRTGSNLMVHGACSSSGCYSMTDDQMDQIYTFARDAFDGGQREFQIQAFPFRMTAANMARYRKDPNYAFWKMLKEGYDHFEITKVPPKVDVCEKRYVFNREVSGDAKFDAAGACPASTQPASLVTAYQSYQKKYDAAFTSASAVWSRSAAPAPSIAGIKEASLVSEWTKKRARGERVPLDPPSLNGDGTVTVTERMGRIDSAAGRRMAALEAKEEAKKKAAEDKARAVAEAKAAKAIAAAPVTTASIPAPAPVIVQTPQQEVVQEARGFGLPSADAVKKRLLGMFGG